MSEEIIYIDCKNWQEFLKFKEKFKDANCEFIVDENYLRGRTPGVVKRLGGYKERWNYIAISESISRMESENEDFFNDKELEQEIDKTGLNEEDLEYGIND